jgi:hypothetical protein
VIVGSQLLTSKLCAVGPKRSAVGGEQLFRGIARPDHHTLPRALFGLDVVLDLAAANEIYKLPTEPLLHMTAVNIKDIHNF